MDNISSNLPIFDPMTFQNLPVHTEQLPRVSELQLHQLDPKSRTSEYISTTILFAILFVVANIIVFSSGGGFVWWVGMIYLIWLVLFGLAMWLVGKNYKVTGYAIRQRDLVFQTGVIVRSVTTIPFKRIQHCEITEGPIQKLFKLASLKVFTAGGSGSDLSISGLQKEEAARIKEFITGKIDAHDEEE